MSLPFARASLRLFATGPSFPESGGCNLERCADGFRAKVHFTDSAVNAGLPSDYTFSSSDNGVHTFSVTLNTAGAQTLTVADTSNGSIVGSVLVTVSPKTSGGGGGGH